MRARSQFSFWLVVILIILITVFGVGSLKVSRTQPVEAQSNESEPLSCVGALFVLPARGELGWTFGYPEGGPYHDKDDQDCYHNPRCSKKHTGIDIIAPPETLVYAAYDGVVTHLDDANVTLRHDLDPEVYTYYRHMQNVRQYVDHEEQWIEKGTKIGEIGPQYNPAHLHFSMTSTGKDERLPSSEIIDPSPYLGGVFAHPEAVAFTRPIWAWCNGLTQTSDIEVIPEGSVPIAGDELTFGFNVTNTSSETILPTGVAVRLEDPSGRIFWVWASNAFTFMEPGETRRWYVDVGEDWQTECRNGVPGTWKATHIWYMDMLDDNYAEWYRVVPLCDEQGCREAMTSFCAVSSGTSGINMLDNGPTCGAEPTPTSPPPPSSGPDLRQAGDVYFAPLPPFRPDTQAQVKVPVHNYGDQTANVAILRIIGNVPPNGTGNEWDTTARDYSIAPSETQIITTEARTFSWPGTYLLRLVTIDRGGDNWYDLPANGYTQSFYFEVQETNRSQCEDETRTGVYLYADKNYEGACAFFEESHPNLGETPVGDNTASSMRVNGAFRIRLFEHPNYQGRYEEFGGSDTDLDWRSLGGQYSSIEVHATQHCEDETLRGVYLYSAKNYQGDCAYFVLSHPNLGDTPVGDNNASSLRVNGEYRVRLFEHPNYAGRYEEFGGSDPDLDWRSLGGQYSSIELHATVHCADENLPGVYLYSSRDYQGDCVHLTESHPNLGDTAVGDNAVVSLRIVGPFWVRIYEHQDYEGRSDEFYDDQPDLDWRSLGRQYSSIEVFVENTPTPTPTYSVSGFVTGPEGQPSPISEVEVCVDGYGCVRTDETGRYRMEGLPQGTYTVTPSKAGYRFNPPDKQVTLPPDIEQVNFVGTPVDCCYHIAGYVTGPEGGQNPLAGIRVDIRGQGSSNTDQNGRYIVAGLEAGRYKVLPYGDGYDFGPVCKWVVVPPNREDINFVAVPAGQPPGVTLYEHDQYRGVHETFTGDYPDLTESCIGDNVVTSIKVRDPYIATLYQDPNYQGTSETFTGDDPQLSSNTIGNDTVSSIRLVTFTPTPSQTPTPTLTFTPTRTPTPTATAGEWSITGGMNTARSGHTATLLLNGKVLVAGGENESGYLSSAEVYDPSTGTWSTTGSMNTPRTSHTMTLLPDGRVLVAGGYNGSHLNSAEVYDPSTGTWSVTSSMNTARADHTATLLLDGKILVTGGSDRPYGYLDSAEVYDPSTGTWSVTSSMNTARKNHSATLLLDGKMLVAGGKSSFDNWLNSAELYDPATGTWSVTGSMNTARDYHAATLLLDGKVLVAGGWYNHGSYLSSAEVYDPVTDTWSNTGSMTTTRSRPPVILLPNSWVLVASHETSSSCPSNAELYDPVTGIWTATSSMNTACGGITATLLTDGKVLVAGGYNGGYLSSAELFQAISTSTPTATPTSTYTPTPTKTSTEMPTPTPTGTPAPILSVPDNVPAPAGSSVSVPVNFTSNGHSIATTAFSVNFDQSCLAFDSTDSDQDSIPDAVTFNVPGTFNASVTFDDSDTDGELDFLIADAFPPLASLPDGMLATITFTAMCQPDSGTSIIAPVGFSGDPPASFGDTEGQSVPGTTSDGSVEISPGGTPGDANGDGAVDAGDISALVLEIFDGDGSNPADTPGGTFPGDPVGCDANEDDVVDAADISCTVLLVFDGPGACGGGGLSSASAWPVPAGPAASAVAPGLAIPDQILASPGSSVTVPVNFTANGNEISSLIFSVDYDETWLTFDPADGDGDSIPGAITFNVPAAFSTSVTYDENDTDGELDFFIADLSPPLTPLSDDTVVSIKLNAGNPSSTTEAAVSFSQDPATSFGSTSGQSVPGTTDDGSVLIVPPTATPTPSNTPTSTPSPTATHTPTGTATVTPTGKPTATITNSPPPTSTATPTFTPTITPSPSATSTPTFTATSTHTPIATFLLTVTPLPTETSRPACDPDDPNSICDATIEVLDFVDRECDTYFDEDDFPLPGSRITFFRPDGGRELKITGADGRVHFVDIDFLPGDEASAEVEHAISYRGYPIISCPNSPSRKRITIEDFDQSRSTLVVFRAKMLVPTPTPTSYHAYLPLVLNIRLPHLRIPLW